MYSIIFTYIHMRGATHTTAGAVILTYVLVLARVMGKVYIAYGAAPYGISKGFDRRSLYIIIGSIGTTSVIVYVNILVQGAAYYTIAVTTVMTNTLFTPLFVG